MRAKNYFNVWHNSITIQFKSIKIQLLDIYIHLHVYFSIVEILNLHINTNITQPMIIIDKKAKIQTFCTLDDQHLLIQS